MKKAILASLFLALGSLLRAESLDLPPRPPTAPKGTAFARSIAALPLQQREEKILAEVNGGKRSPIPADARSGVGHGRDRQGDVRRRSRLSRDWVGRRFLPHAADAVHRPDDRGSARLLSADTQDG